MSEYGNKSNSKEDDEKRKRDAQSLLELSPLNTDLAEDGNNHSQMAYRRHYVAPFWKQMLGASGPTVSVLSSGMTAGYSAILLPQLESPASSIAVTDDTSSWIASIAVVAMAVGCIFISVLMDKLGRRRSLQVFSIPATVGWIIIIFSSDVYMLYVGRFLTGLYVGLSTPVSTVFIAETSAPKYRGFLIAGSNLGIPVGIFVTHLLGAVCSWWVVAIVCAAFPFISLVLISLVPESPHHLFAQHHLSEAKRSFEWYRDNKNEDVRELKQLLEKYECQNTEIAKTSESSTFGLKVMWKHLLQQSFQKPLFILLVFFFIQQFSGINAIIFYTVTMFEEMGISIDEYLATIVLDGMRILASVAACWLLRHYGRRPLAVFSALSTAVTLILLGVYFCISDSLGKGNQMTWIPVLLLNLYILTVGIGLVPLPWVMTGEVFPATTRAIGSGLSSCFGFVVFFVVVKTGPTLFKSMGTAYTFILYGVISFLGFVFLCRYLPETKNKTLQQIEETRGRRGVK